jgi:hypothetical protein
MRIKWAGHAAHVKVVYTKNIINQTNNKHSVYILKLQYVVSLNFVLFFQFVYVTMKPKIVSGPNT